MFTSITETPQIDTQEQVPTSSPPRVWVGFLFAFAFFFLELVFVIMTFQQEEGPSDSEWALAIGFIGLPGMIYWMFCVHRIHKILAEMTQGRYPISPNEAALKHLIPFYNLYWIFKWPGEFSDYLNRKGRVKMISGSLIGLMLLLSLLVYRLFDGAVGMAAVFGLTMFISSKLKAHIKELKGLTPEQLPPLPDPRIFSRPIETSTNPDREAAEEPRIG